MLLPGVETILIGCPSAVIPLAVFVYVPKVDGRAQFNWSVNVVPLQALPTVCMFVEVPIFSIKSVLVAKEYTLAKSVGRVYSNIKSVEVVVAPGVFPEKDSCSTLKSKLITAPFLRVTLEKSKKTTGLFTTTVPSIL